MPTRDVIVVGASAGGVETLSRLVSGLPEDLPASVFVILHFPAHATSVLPSILARAGRLPAVVAEDGARVEQGRIYCAPSGSHLLFEDGVMRLWNGPRENGHRPAIDPAMRSAAVAYGERVIGVILTGMLDDGTNGLVRIKAHGGLAVVQSPGDALFAGMPTSALANVSVDYVAPVAELPSLLARLAGSPIEEITMSSGNGERTSERTAEVADEEPGQAGRESGPPSEYTCPECHGTLYQADGDSDALRFRCRVGHAYSVETLVSEQTVALEAALWTALRSLEESAALSRQMAERSAQRGQRLSSVRFASRANDLESRATLVRQALEAHGVLPDVPTSSEGTATAAL